MPTTKRLLTDETGQSLVTAINNIVAAVKPNATEIQMSSSDTTTVATAITNINDKMGTVPSGQTVEGQITTLNSKMQNQILTYGIVPTSIGANSNMSLVKTGNVAILDVINLILPNNISADTLIAQLPVAPAVQTFATFETLSGKSVFAFVSADGLKISGITGAEANDNIYGSIVFITTET